MNSSLKLLLSDVPPIQLSLFLLVPSLLSFQVARFSCFGPGVGQQKLGCCHLQPCVWQQWTGLVVMSMMLSCNSCRLFLAPSRVQSSALAAARDAFISDMELRSPFDWRARFSIQTCVSRRAEVAASNIASILESLAPLQPWLSEVVCLSKSFIFLVKCFMHSSHIFSEVVLNLHACAVSSRP